MTRVEVARGGRSAALPPRGYRATWAELPWVLFPEEGMVAMRARMKQELDRSSGDAPRGVGRGALHMHAKPCRVEWGGSSKG